MDIYFRGLPFSPLQRHLPILGQLQSLSTGSSTMDSCSNVGGGFGQICAESDYYSRWFSISGDGRFTFYSDDVNACRVRGPFVWTQGVKRGSTWEQWHEPELGESAV